MFTHDNIRYVDFIATKILLMFCLQYRKYRPREEEFEKNRSKALLQFAGTAILEEVQERRRKWTWAYFAERRDDRKTYVELFKKKLQNPLVGQVSCVYLRATKTFAH